ncbi:MAG: 2-C-methyl-D-erythritol 2,4-cyclodiphosphate synthase [Planctomycetota bacterium]
MTGTRVGLGYDIHRFGPGRRLVVGGVEIEGEEGLVGHSDADVLLHALCDALLGAAGLGDIGEHFPDTDPLLEGASSVQIAERVLGLVADAGYELVNADVTVVTQKPRLGGAKDRIRSRLAEILGVPTDRVNVKAKTREGLGAVGEGKAMEAHAVVLLTRGEK